MFLLLAFAAVGRAATIDQKLWVSNGTVRAVVTDGSTIYLGGQFTRVGPATGAAVAIDGITGEIQQPYPQVAGVAYAVAPDGNGGWYLGGNFTAVRGQPRGNLAPLDPAGNLTPWNPSANYVVT